MLAQNFKTAADLQITDAEFDALAKVLGMLERGEIVEPTFNMLSIGSTRKCNTPACILGWAHRVARIDEDNDGGFLMDWGAAKARALGDLFLYKCTDVYSQISKQRHVSTITPAQAALALRSYLTHGEPRWAEALAT